MQLLFEKILTLGGWFYISLFLISLASVFLNKKLLLSLVLAAAVCFSVRESLKQIRLFSPALTHLTESPQRFLNRTTQGQFAYANRLLARHPHSRFCILLDDDVTGTYLYQKLYPAATSLITKTQPPIGCDYLVDTHGATR